MSICCHVDFLWVANHPRRIFDYSNHNPILGQFNAKHYSSRIWYYLGHYLLITPRLETPSTLIMSDLFDWIFRNRNSPSERLNWRVFWTAIFSVAKTNLFFIYLHIFLMTESTYFNPCNWCQKNVVRACWPLDINHEPPILFQ